jgi:hypothetical protein
VVVVVCGRSCRDVGERMELAIDRECKLGVWGRIRERNVVSGRFVRVRDVRGIIDDVCFVRVEMGSVMGDIDGDCLPRSANDRRCGEEKNIFSAVSSDREKISAGMARVLILGVRERKRETSKSNFWFSS